jgi:ferredoxin-NADP reductase
MAWLECHVDHERQCGYGLTDIVGSPVGRKREVNQVVERIRLRVAEKTMLTPHVVGVRLVSEAGELPPAEPGAHVEVTLRNGIARQYSVVPSPTRGDWCVAVLREADSRGGSAYIHEKLAVGDVVEATKPRSLFPLEEGLEYLFLAGGIGITPFLSLIEEAERRGRPWNLVYTGKSAQTMAYASALQSRYGERVAIHETCGGTRIDCAKVISAYPHAEVYCCGPTSFIDGVKAAAEEAGRDLHIEHFHGDAKPQEGDQTFELELVDTGITLTVPPDRTALDVVDEAGVFVPSSCREGNCGTCETAVLSGEIDHRDVVLSPKEKAQNSCMMLCVSRAAAGTSLVRIKL